MTPAKQSQTNEPRKSGWEYLGVEIAGPQPTIQDVMTQATLNGLPENGGWELMLPWQQLPTGGILLILKRPLSAIIKATSLNGFIPMSPRGDGPNGR